jgi:hypothetical protein
MVPARKHHVTEKVVSDGREFAQAAVAEMPSSLKPLQARRVEIIMDVVRQVEANELDRKAEARCPLLRDGFKFFWR